MYFQLGKDTLVQSGRKSQLHGFRVMHLFLAGSLIKCPVSEIEGTRCSLQNLNYNSPQIRSMLSIIYMQKLLNKNYLPFSIYEIQIDRKAFHRFIFLISPSENFLQHKYEGNRRLAIVSFIVCPMIWIALWGWDVATDPVGAQQTLGLRLLFCLNFLYVPIFVFCKQRKTWIGIATLLGTLASEANYIFILNRLDDGFVYGLAGFMYCMLVAVFLFQCFSLAVNIAFTLSAATLPHVMNLLGLIPNFTQLNYSVLIWPATFLVIIIQLVQSYDYLIRYLLEQQLEELSNSDPLTGLFNRRHFMPLLNHEIQRAIRTEQRLSLLVLDIDNFKSINDNYGHPTGDKVIAHVAQVCSKGAREIDVTARLGGEEFAVLLVGCGIEKATSVAERIRSVIEESSMEFFIDTPFQFTVSIGVAELKSKDDDASSLYSRADKSLYHAKEGGRNKVVVT